MGAKVGVYSVEAKVYGKELMGGARVYGGVEARVYGSHCILLSAPVPWIGDWLDNAWSYDICQ